MSVRHSPLLCVCSQFSSSRSLWSLWLKSVRQFCVSVISDGAYVKCRMVKICSQFSMCLIVISSPFKVGEHNSYYEKHSSMLSLFTYTRNVYTGFTCLI